MLHSHDNSYISHCPVLFIVFMWHTCSYFFLIDSSCSLFCQCHIFIDLCGVARMLHSHDNSYFPIVLYSLLSSCHIFSLLIVHYFANAIYLFLPFPNFPPVLCSSFSPRHVCSRSILTFFLCVLIVHYFPNVILYFLSSGSCNCIVPSPCLMISVALSNTIYMCYMYGTHSLQNLFILIKHVAKVDFA